VCVRIAVSIQAGCGFIAAVGGGGGSCIMVWWCAAIMAALSVGPRSHHHAPLIILPCLNLNNVLLVSEADKDMSTPQIVLFYLLVGCFTRRKISSPTALRKFGPRTVPFGKSKRFFLEILFGASSARTSEGVPKWAGPIGPQIIYFFCKFGISV
jgi:hypothetical protein